MTQELKYNYRHWEGFYVEDLVEMTKQADGFTTFVVLRSRNLHRI